MKIKHFLISLLLPLVLLSLSNFVYAQNESHGLSFIYGENEISYKFSDLDLAKTLSWKPEQEEPPVSLQRALEIARANLPRFVKNADVFKAKHIALHSLVQSEGKWYYDISFDCEASECLKNSDKYFRVLVKMDGRIIEPTITPVKDKQEMPR